MDNETQYIFPFSCINPGSRLVIYGAGNVGRCYWEQMKMGKYCQIMAVVDKAYNQYDFECMPVVPLEYIRQIEYDLVVIALAFKNQAYKAMKCLEQEYGVPKEKIFWHMPEKISTKKQHKFFCVDTLILVGRDVSSSWIKQQMSQLSASGMSCRILSIKTFSIESIMTARTFIFFHCVLDAKLESIIKKARFFNKSILLALENDMNIEPDRNFIDLFDGIIINDECQKRLLNLEDDKIFVNRTVNEEKWFLTGIDFRNFILAKQKTNIGIVLTVTAISVPGGVIVALKHADILRRNGYDVVILNPFNRKGNMVSKYYFEKNIGMIWLKYTTVECYFDKVVATAWDTVPYLTTLSSGQRYYLVQSYETDFLPKGDQRRYWINSTYCNRTGMNYVTISLWCKSWLEKVFLQKVKYAPNGLNCGVFFPKVRDFNQKIRILIEGDSSSTLKNLDESFHIVQMLDLTQYEIWYVSYNARHKDWYHVDHAVPPVSYANMPDVYRKCHILLKSSILESFSYPPLEMMATGGFVVARENDGNREYLKNGYNCMLYDSDNLQSAVDAIWQICKDDQLRKKLYSGGLHTALKRDWKNCEMQVLDLYR